MNAPVNHRFPADLRASFGIRIFPDGGAFRVALDLKNALLGSTALSGVQVIGIDPATGVTKLYPLAGGGDTLPPGGAVGNVLGLTSLSPRTYGWLVPSGGGVAFGTTAGTATEGNDARVVGAMQKAANGSDIADKAAFRGNLGLGNAALATIGTTNGTVAAGNDPRFPAQALGNAAYRSVGSSSGTVAAGDDSRFPTAPLGAAAYLNVGTAAGTVAAGDDPRFNAILGQTVLMYGAKGDGVTDDTAAFNAMAAAEGRIIVPRRAAGYVINGRVGSLTNNAKLQILGEGATITKLLLGANGGLDVSGRGWRVEGLGFVPTATVECALRCGTGTDNTGSAIKSCTFVADGNNGKYFKIACDLLNWWYGVIDGCYFQNNLISDPNAGIALRFSYSVNDSIINNSFYGWDTAYLWTSTPNPAPDTGNTCEGHTISNNFFVVNRRHIVFDDGLLPLILNNVLDLVKPNGNALVCNATDAIVIGNWFAFLSNSPLGNADDNQALVTFSKDSHVVQGNVWGASVSGIALNITNCGYSVFSGNQIRGYSQGMTANSGCTNITVFANKFLNQKRDFANANLSLVTDLTWFANDRLGGSGFILPGSYNGAGGGQSSGPAQYHLTTVLTVGAAANTVQWNVPLPSGRFSAKPAVHVTLASVYGADFKISATADPSNVQVTFNRPDGQPVAAGQQLEFNVSAFAQG